MGMRWTPKADGVLMPLKIGHEVDAEGGRSPDAAKDVIMENEL